MATLLKLAPRFDRMLTADRDKEVRRAMKAVIGYPIDALPELLQVKEDYLPGFFQKIYVGVGSDVAKEAFRQFMNRKADVDIDWERRMASFIDEYIGQKINIVSGSLKDYLIDQTRRQAAASLAADAKPIEVLTQGLYDDIIGAWDDAKDWQIRRIVNTELLSCSSMAQHAGIVGTGVQYTHTWMIAGHNTRPAHIAMDGERIAMGEYHYPDGEKMEYPRDVRFGASAGNIINCMCTELYDPL